MFIRSRNDCPEARERGAQVLERIKVLEALAGERPDPTNAAARLELASRLSWQGRYRSVLALVEPLTSSAFPIDVQIPARQIIADVYFRHDQFDLADRQYREVLRLAEPDGNEYWIARARDGLAWVLIEIGHVSSGEFAEAAQIFETTLPIYQRLGMTKAEGMALHGMSRSVAGLGHYDQAIEYANRAIEFLRAHDGEDFVQLPLLQLAMVYRDFGAFERARPFFDEAIDAADRSQDPATQLAAALGFGSLLQYLGEMEEGRRLWESILPACNEMGFPRIGQEVCSKLATQAAERGDFKNAYQHQTACQEFGNQIGVISASLQNQQLLLRAQIQKSAQLEDTLIYLTAGIEASSDGIFVLGAPQAIDKSNFVIQYVNSAAAALLGRRPQDLISSLVRERWRTPSAQLLLDASWIVYHSGAARTLDPIQLRFPGAEESWYSVKIARISNGVAWTVCDVSEREAMQTELTLQRDRLTDANERLTALDREKSEMMGMAAHDLRSPIANIHAICDFIPRQDEEVKHWVDLIENVSASMLELIGNLLDVNRIERGEVNLRIDPIDVAALFERVESEFGARASQKQIVIVNATPLSRPTVLGDQESLLKVMENLVSNALKFSSPGTSVELHASSSGGCVRLEVRDQGPGISAEDHKKLFGKFVRLAARPTAGESSTGLGLSIVKRLVEGMGGEIGCESEPGKGAIFWIELPSADDSV